MHHAVKIGEEENTYMSTRKRNFNEHRGKCKNLAKIEEMYKFSEKFV